MSLPPPHDRTGPNGPKRLAVGHRHRRTRLRLGLGILLVLAIATVGSLLIDVRAKLGELSSSPQDNVQWTISQLEVELLALTLAVSESRADPGPASLNILRQRYDILYSRLDTLEHSKLYRNAFTDPRLAADFEALATDIRGLAPIIDGPDDRLADAAAPLIQTLTDLRDRTRAVTALGSRSLAQQSDASRADVFTVLLRLALATGFLLIVLAAMVVLFRRLAVTSDLRLRQNLATSARLEAIFSTSRDGIAVVRHDGTIVNLNTAAKRLFGIGEQGMQGADIGTLLTTHGSGGTEPVTGGQLFRMARSGHTTGVRLTGQKQTGGSLPVEISVDVSAREDEPICVCVIRDISRQTETEEALKTSRDQALAGERAKARFLGVISHEMRTPLNGILGTLDLIDEARADPTAQTTETTEHYLQILRRSSETLLTLVNDVLDITQIEGGLKLTDRSFDLDLLLSDLIASEAGRARAQGNEITLVAQAPLGHVRGDPDRLRQVLANLLVNANKFTRHGQITLDAARLPDGQIEFQLTDTGEGMTSDDLARVFDDFVRTDRAVELQVQGTGLGLGIARTLVEAMRGEIGAESEPGEGSLFWVRVPLPAAPPVRTATDTVNPSATPARILLVEDNETNRFIARKLLENDGHRVTEAAHGAEAVDIAAHETFDAIFMDISMPVMDGAEAAGVIRASSGPNRGTRIIALTAHVAAGLDETRTRDVMDAVLHKPLNRNDMRRQIAIAVADLEAVPEEPTALAEPLKGLDARTTADLIDRFVTYADPLFAALPARLNEATPDTSTLAHDLHDLAGTCANFGQRPLHAKLAQAEAEVRAGHPEPARQIVAEAAALWHSARASLLAEMARAEETAQAHPAHQA